MTFFKFEGDLSNISARQLEYISSVLQDRGYKNEKVVIEPVGKAGDNYVANVKRIIVKTKEEPFQMIAKFAPSNEGLRTALHSNHLFTYENFMYTAVLKKFAELENDANIPESERLRFAACYGSIMEEPNEVILLEDLNVSNFVMLDRFKSLTPENVKLVLRSFARLHSLSYVLRNQDPKTFRFFSKHLVNMFEVMEISEDVTQFMEKLENDIIAVLDNEGHRRRIKNSLTQMVPQGVKLLKFYKEQNCSAILQGDSWTNNIMFRLEGENVAECCMIDYQLSSHSSPVFDLHYMIFNCTDYESRSKYYHEWIDYYYIELDKCLSYHGLKVYDFYTRDRLDADLRRNGKVAFAQAIMGASMLMRDHSEAAEAKAAFEKDKNIQDMVSVTLGKESLIRFKERVDGFVKSFVELGFIL